MDTTDSTYNDYIKGKSFFLYHRVIDFFIERKIVGYFIEDIVYYLLENLFRTVIIILC